IFRPFENQSATRTDSRAGLANGLIERKVPRGKGGTHANRLTHHQLSYGRITGRDNPTINPTTLLRMPFGVLGTHLYLSPGFAQGLALVQGDIAPNLGSALPGQFGNAAQNAGALQRRALAPLFECPIGSCQSSIQVVPTGMRQ